MSKSTFAERLNTALDILDFPPKGRGRVIKLAEMTGLTNKGVGKWFRGIGSPPANKYNALAKLLKVNATWLKTGEGPMMEPLPVYPASDFLLSDKEPIQTINSNINVRHDLFAILLDSDAMFPRFSQGNIAIFDAKRAPRDGDFVFVMHENYPAPLFRQAMIVGSTFYLEAYNPKFDRLTLTDASQVLGTMIQAIIDF